MPRAERAPHRAPPEAEAKPRVVLVCHEESRIDAEGLAAWLAASFKLIGIVALREGRKKLLERARREIHRSGSLGFLDVLAFRAYYRLARERSDAAWATRELSRLRAQYPAALQMVPKLVAPDPNTATVRRFLEDLQPDLMLARCKVLLQPGIFNIPRRGTFVLHPGICPEYRNAHGCFWALANRDLERVGMTLLQVDHGIDTGPIFLQASYSFDELRESHLVIQYRVVLANLDAIRDALISVWKGTRRPIATDGRRSAMWGQPRLSAYVRWRWAARRKRLR